jgi:ParB-like chromosome segregation protein Spo0J
MGPTFFISLDEVVLPAKQRKKLVRDRGQIEEMRCQIEEGVAMIPIKVWRRDDGLYCIVDGRHRYLAHELAEVGVIEAMLI